MLNPNELFNENFYLAKNPDVAAAVANGIFSSGAQHFFTFGEVERRDPSAFFDTNYYLEQNPDVVNSISPQLTVFEHFIQFGQFENRIPTPFFNSNWYQINNPDVVAAVERDELTGLFVHFVEFGAEEGRSPSPVYNNSFYLQRNPDVAAAVQMDIVTGIEHFIVFGAREGRSASEVFNPSFYRNTYTDVAQAVELGNFESGVEHFLRFGRNEGRDSVQAFSLPIPTGPFAVDMTSYFFTDPSRPEIFTPDPNDVRQLTVDVWYPGMFPSPPLPPIAFPPEPYLNPLVAQAIAPQQGLSANFYDLVAPTSGFPLVVSDAQPSYPVVLFSHGLGALPDFYTTQLRNLASHGYIVAAISHTYISAVTVFPDGQVVPFARNFLPSDPRQLETALVQAIGETSRDASFVLDQLTNLNANDPNNLFAGKLDLSRVGIFGQSFGGITTTSAIQRDRRFQAGLSMDGLIISPQFVRPIDRPFMLINADRTFKNTFLGQALGTVDRVFRPVLFNAIQGPGYNLRIQGTAHSNFSDRGVLFPLIALYSPDRLGLPGVFDVGLTDIGSLNGERAIAIVNDYTVSFFDRYLKNQLNQPLLAGAMPFPEVQFNARNTA